jgi:hypothetical protein
MEAGKGVRLQSKASVNTEITEAVTVPAFVNILMEAGVITCLSPLIGLTEADVVKMPASINENRKTKKPKAG